MTRSRLFKQQSLCNMAGQNERSNYIRSFLRGGLGQVDSVFQHSLNVAFDDELLHIGSIASGLSVFGITLANGEIEPLLAAVQVNDEVIFRQGQLTIYTRSRMFRYPLDKFGEKDLRIPRMIVDHNRLTQLTALANEMQISADIGLSQENYHVVKQGLTAPMRTSISHTIDFMIGRGKGLTPSGDDMLVGYLSVLQALQHPANAMFTAPLRAKVNQQATTRVSRNYITALLDGYVSADILALLQALTDNIPANELAKRMHTVLTMGHTSGHDTIMGMVLAAHMILGGNENGK